MPSTKRFAEDQLTETLAALLQHTEARKVFWERFAPPRLVGRFPDAVKTFRYFGGTRPDILFLCRDEAVFYVEAKLDSGTEPMQLSRARSKMRLANADDDQVLLVSRTVDAVPEAVGWVGSTLPCFSTTWKEILAAFDQVRGNWPVELLSALELFRRTWNLLAKKQEHTKQKQLALASGHPYGAVFQAVTKQWDNTKADFSYGGGIAPRVNFGLPEWQTILGTRDVERMSIECGFRRKENGEFYASAFCLWHASDLKDSRDGIAPHWKHWRREIMADPAFKVHIGGRGEFERTFVDPPPEIVPRLKVAILRRPGSMFPVSEISDLPLDAMVTRVSKLARPYIALAERVLKSVV